MNEQQVYTVKVEVTGQAWVQVYADNPQHANARVQAMIDRNEPRDACFLVEFDNDSLEPVGILESAEVA